MKTLVVYDSLYGNTRIIAQAIAGAMPGDVQMVHVKELDVSQLRGYDLLIVGAPTHGGRPSDAVKGLLQRLSATSLAGIKVAAFDTRLPWGILRLFGFAAPKIARGLKKKGGQLVCAAAGFLVVGSEGPLQEGEAARAAAWAKEIVALVAPETPVASLAF